MFFALTGLRTRIGLVTGMHAWLLTGLVILVACVGKFGGSLVAARLTGCNWRDASVLGVLMNALGMTELIVLNINLRLRVIGPRLFAILVIVSLLTTMATTPPIHWLERGERPQHGTKEPASTGFSNLWEVFRKNVRTAPSSRARPYELLTSCWRMNAAINADRSHSES